jgi:hypothetical protein
MLEHFERSLPNSVRLVVVAPLALLVTMVVAFVIARYWIQTPSGNLMGSLASAALELDRGKALEAFKDNRVQAASTSERWSS